MDCFSTPINIGLNAKFQQAQWHRSVCVWDLFENSIKTQENIPLLSVPWGCSLSPLFHLKGEADHRYLPSNHCGVLQDPKEKHTGCQPQSCSKSLKNHVFYTLTTPGGSTGWKIINHTIWLLKIALRPSQHFSRLPYADYGTTAQ